MVSNGNKRKKSEALVSDRPAKQMKSETPSYLNGVETPGSEVIYAESDADEPRILPPVAATADTAEWQATIENVVRNVVSINFCQTCSFDTEPASHGEATGFIVDVEKGYILTNRHVAGSVRSSVEWWKARLSYHKFRDHFGDIASSTTMKRYDKSSDLAQVNPTDKRQCDVYPVYVDPVHDFGILKFDPKAIKYMPLTALELRPYLARVGVEIRVVGNDAGEKLSILSGVISRLDRNAPEYGEGYCDFNTNYIQAAAAASGGSSGSPVVNLDGYAVALQAGGRMDGAATDYFLPLDRPLRALECIRNGQPVTRGTIQTQWLIKPFDECRRLGLTPDWEAAIRTGFPSETGMLVAEIVLPEGPGDSKIEEGDVLIKVNGELLTKFIRLDSILDSSVGKTVTILVQRGGKDVKVELIVGDLHAITPDRFVTVAGGAFHDLSYQQARMYAIPVRGVYVCEAAGSFRFENTESGWIIESVDQKKTPDLNTFIEVMRSTIALSHSHNKNRTNLARRHS
ncbi:MAG: hypothetical protein MMC33_005006 [Icmadophila ericetorum]|nr:hypothetical protein [Icmadophila ericetorum]